jgi:hypothetical protein
VAFSIVLAVCTEGRGEHARPVPEYYCTGFLLAFGSVVLVMAILYIIVPSRMYMRGENFWPDLDPNLLKRIMGSVHAICWRHDSLRSIWTLMMATVPR